jgi:small subunit ribosomal protein S1
LGGADGLIHLSELSWRRVRHPREVLKVGDEVEVYVLRLDEERKRIGLSLKRLQPEPWALVEDKYELGQLVEGVVTNVTDFGAFAEIEEGVEGLIHVSELAEAPISHPKEVVKKGDLLLLRIIRIDIRRKRLGLSLKRVLESEWAEWAAHLAVSKADESKEAEETDSLEAEEFEESEESKETPEGMAEVTELSEPEQTEPEAEPAAETIEQPEEMPEPAIAEVREGSPAEEPVEETEPAVVEA